VADVDTTGIEVDAVSMVTKGIEEILENQVPPDLPDLLAHKVQESPLPSLEDFTPPTQ
jgi:hypothetical protein